MSCSALHRHKDLRTLFELGMLGGVTVDSQMILNFQVCLDCAFK